MIRKRISKPNDFKDHLDIFIEMDKEPITEIDMSHVMRKPVYAICEQQRRRSACASAQSGQCLYCSLPG